MSHSNAIVDLCYSVFSFLMPLKRDDDEIEICIFHCHRAGAVRCCAELSCPVTSHTPPEFAVLLLLC